MIQISKVNIGIDGIYIGRGTPLGNPYHIGKDGDRVKVIEKYRQYLTKKIQDKDPIILEALNKIKQYEKDFYVVTLLCHCKPLACHGDIIKEILDGENYYYPYA